VKQATKLARWVGWLAVLASMACAAENPASLRLNGNVVVTRTDKTLNLCYPIQAQALRTVGVLDLMSLASTYGEYTYYASVDNVLQSIDIPSGGNKEAQLRSPRASTITVTGVTAALVDNDDGTQLPKDYKSTKMPVTSASVVLGTESPLATQVGWSAPAAQVIEPQARVMFPITLVPANVFTEWWKVFNALAPDVRGKRVDRLTVRVALTGKLADGTAVASGTVDYPLQVCWGCLMMVPIDPTVETPADNAKACVATSVPSDYIVPCVPGQDEYQPCQQYCQFCRNRELSGAKTNTQGACDPRFCPALTEEDLVKFGLK
jgi:hypothetical protein